MPLAPSLRPAVAVAAITTSLLTASCATAGSTPVGQHAAKTLIERDRSNGTTVGVQVGRRIDVILSSSYWNFHGSSAPAVVRQQGPVAFLAPPPGGCVPGGGCRPVRAVFIALKSGRAVITASRTSCGEALRCSPSQSHFRLTLLVR